MRQGMQSAACGHRALAAEGNGFGVASRPKETALSLDPSRKGAGRAPLQPTRRRKIAMAGFAARAVAPWTTTGVSAPASSKRETSALPLQTHRPGNGAPRNPRKRRAGDGGGSVPITAMRARGKRADRGGMTALSMMHDGEETRSPDLLPAPV